MRDIGDADATTGLHDADAGAEVAFAQAALCYHAKFHRASPKSRKPKRGIRFHGVFRDRRLEDGSSPDEPGPSLDQNLRRVEEQGGVVLQHG